MGQHIRERSTFGYTIGLFAGGGRFLDVALSVHDLPPVNKVGVERLLASVGEPHQPLDVTD
jgi:hypothetical protein